jgi:hypothetical protein
MAKFSDYLDQYPDILPGNIKGPTLFTPPTSQGSFFERFLNLQANPEGALLQRIQLPDRLREFMAIGGLSGNIQ